MVYEDGVCGRTSVFYEKDAPEKCGIDAIKNSVAVYSADVLVLMLGTNDCKYKFRADAEKITSGVLKVAEEARREKPDIKVILCAPVRILPQALLFSDYYDEKSIQA